MKTLRFFGLIFVSAAIFALPAAAQTADGLTPSNEDTCDKLADKTPGLQGLCVAMCEAQDCEAEIDPFTEEVVFDPSCSPSSQQLLANYNRIKTDDDPPMPCVKAACPCWTEASLDNIGGRKLKNVSSDGCSVVEGQAAGIWGASTDRPGSEFAYVSNDPFMGLMCQKLEMTDSPPYYDQSITADVFATCYESVVDECNSRNIKY